jgi:hypothetical protein
MEFNSAFKELIEEERHVTELEFKVWQLCALIPLAKDFAGTTENVEKDKECVALRQRKGKGRKKVR